MILFLTELQHWSSHHWSLSSLMWWQPASRDKTGNVIVTCYILLVWLVQSHIPTGWLDSFKAANLRPVVCVAGTSSLTNA